MELSNGERKYLLGVLMTLSDYGWTRLKWVSDYFGVRMPTAKEFLESLARKGLLEYRRRGSISFTKEGLRLALREKEKLDTIRDFLVRVLLLDEEKALDSAFKILFDLDDEVSDRMYKFLNFMNECTAEEPVFVKKFEEFLKGEYKACEYCPIIFVKRGWKVEGERSQIPREEDNGIR